MNYDRLAAVVATAVAAAVAITNRQIVSLTFDRAAMGHGTD